MDRKQILLDSIKKLLSLNIPDDEIISNLKEVGLTKEEAKGLLAEAKGGPVPTDRIVQKTVKEEKEIKEEEEEEEEEEEKEEIKKPKVKKEISVKKKPVKEDMSSGGLDAMIKRRIKEEMQSELDKVQVLLDSQRELLTDKIETGLEEKSGQIIESLNEKIEEMRELAKKTERSISELSEQRKTDQASAMAVTAKIEELQKIKEGFESSLQESKSKLAKELDVLITEEAEKIAELEDKMNKTLTSKNADFSSEFAKLKEQVHALESKPKPSGQDTHLAQEFMKLQQQFKEMDTAHLTQDFLNLQKQFKEMDKRVGQAISGKNREFSEQFSLMQEKVQGLDEGIDQKLGNLERSIDLLSKKVSVPQKVDLSPIEVRLSSLEKKLATGAFNGELDAKISKKISEAVAMREQAMTEILKEKIKEIESTAIKGIDIGQLNTTLKEMDGFRKQFLTTIQGNVKEFKKAKADLEQSVGKHKKEVVDLSQELKLKMAELDAFEDKFAMEMGLVVDKAIEKKTAKQNQKKKGKRR